MRTLCPLGSSIFLLLLALFPTQAQAAFVDWTIDSAQSQLSVEVSANSLYFGALTTGSQVRETTLGLSTHVLGQFVSTAVEPTTTNIFFVGGFLALNSFSWAPLPGGSPGFAGANLGVLMDHDAATEVTGSIFAAFRQISIGFPGNTLTGAGAGDFTGVPNIIFSAGTMDYFSTGDLSFYGLGQTQVSDFFRSSSSGIAAHIDFDSSPSPTTATMTLTFDVVLTKILDGSIGQFSYPLLLSTEFHGQIVAHSTAVVPEASTLWMTSAALVGAWGWLRRPRIDRPIRS